MARAHRFALVALLAVAPYACGGEAPQAISLPQRAAPEPPPPSPARWLLADDDGAIAAKVDVGDGRTLYVGKNGVRELGDGKPKSLLVPAPAIVVDDFVGVQRDAAGSFVFLVGDGATYTSTEPLGPLSGPRPGPLASSRKAAAPSGGASVALKSLATGAVAIVAVTEDGRVFRSTDHGVSWGKITYTSGNQPFGYASEVALDSKGNGVLLHFPQRLFITHDDGATWAPLSTSNFGARCVTRDGADRLFLCGHHGRALRLEGDKVVLARPEDFVPMQPSSEALLSPPTPVGASGPSTSVAAYGSEVVSVREDPSVGDPPSTSTVLRSADGGRTFRREAQLEGTDPFHGTRVVVAVGPKGWTYIASLCRRIGGNQKCSYQKVRPSGAAALEDMLVDEAFEPTAFVFDASRDRVLAVGRHDQEVGLYESRLSENRFRRRKLVLSASSTPFLTLDLAGTIHTLSYAQGKSAWVMNRIDVHGEQLTALYLPFAQDSSFVFAGAHGLAFELPHDNGWAMGVHQYVVWETADAGETWSRVATPRGFDGHAQCTEAGCLEGKISRVGWDLPALQGAETLAATPQAEPRAERQRTSPPTSPALAPARRSEELVCKPAGARAIVPSFPGSSLNLRMIVDAWERGVRWAVVKGTWHETSEIDPSDAVSVVVGSRTEVRELPLVPEIAASVRADTRSGLRVDDDSVIVARYETHDHWQGRSALDVELAFWSAATGRVSHAVVRHVPPFEVSAYGTSIVGAVRIVEGGLLFQPPSSSASYFVQDDGHVDPLELPAGISMTGALRLGKRWLVSEARGADADLWWKEDGSTSWTERSWTLGEFGERAGGYEILEHRPFDATFSLFRKKPFLAITGPWKAVAFALDGAIAEDPPPPIVFDAAHVEAPCGAGAAAAREVTPSLLDGGVRVRVEAAGKVGQLAVSRRVTHETEAGGFCTSVYLLHGNDPTSSEAQDGLLYPDAKGGSGWWFVRTPNPKKKGENVLEAVPLTCAVRP